MNARKIAEERIRILFNQAEDRYENSASLSNRYIELAQRIGERTQVSIPQNLKKHFCSDCNTYWKHGDNCKIRINSEKQLIQYRCLKCGAEKRYGY